MMLSRRTLPYVDSDPQRNGLLGLPPLSPRAMVMLSRRTLGGGRCDEARLENGPLNQMMRGGGCGGTSSSLSRSLEAESAAFHRQPEVNYLPCFGNDDLPCRLHKKHVVCRVNHRSRNRVNSSPQVAGGAARLPRGGTTSSSEYRQPGDDSRLRLKQSFGSTPRS